MKFLIRHFHPPMTDNSVPASVPIWGEHETVSDARQHGVLVATLHPQFRPWCVAFHVEDANGEVVSDWVKDRDAPPC